MWVLFDTCLVRSLAFFLPARRYASAATSYYGLVSVCLCLCLSVTSGNSSETAEQVELVFGMRAFNDLSYIVL